MQFCDRCNHLHKPESKVVCPCGCHDKGICTCNTSSNTGCKVHFGWSARSSGTNNTWNWEDNSS